MLIQVQKQSAAFLRSIQRIFVIRTHMTHAVTENNMASNGTPTVGIIVIGDEILKGHVKDTNSHFLCKRLFSLGVKVKKISVVPDDLDIIASEVAQFSSTFTHVITSGGIGPTHDDMTFEGVAQAFNEKVIPHPDLVAACKHFFGTDDLTSPKLKLAHVPHSAKLLYGVDKVTGEKHKYPLVQVKNVYVFPGIPFLMERAFIMLEDLFRNPSAAFHVKEIYINKDEMSITPILNEFNDAYKEKIILGSYPEFHNSYYKVKLTLEAAKEDDLESASEYLHSRLPPNSVMDFEKDPIGRAADRVYELMSRSDGPISHSLQSALQVVEECFQKYKPEEVCVGFNGGKDCTVILHIAHAVYRKMFPDRKDKLNSMYIRRGTPFPELELFITKSVERYKLEQVTINGRIKDAMTEFKKTHPHIKAVIMGTRRSDPYSDHLSSFIMTDPDWPQFMRVNPILDWSYSDVWQVIRNLCVPYCSLYDNGYTSLGSMENTHPNPDLRLIDDKGIISYRPAYLLQDSNSERAGRN